MLLLAVGSALAEPAQMRASYDNGLLTVEVFTPGYYTISVDGVGTGRSLTPSVGSLTFAWPREGAWAQDGTEHVIYIENDETGVSSYRLRYGEAPVVEPTDTTAPVVEPTDTTAPVIDPTDTTPPTGELTIFVTYKSGTISYTVSGLTTYGELWLDGASTGISVNGSVSGSFRRKLEAGAHSLRLYVPDWNRWANGGSFNVVINTPQISGSYTQIGKLVVTMSNLNGYTEIWMDGSATGASLSSDGSITINKTLAEGTYSLLAYDPDNNVKGYGSVTVSHIWEKIPAVAPSCTEAGKAEGRKCLICGAVEEGAVVPALGHQTEKIPGKDATCTETGLTEGEKCSRCGEILKAQEEIAAKGHTPEKIAGKKPTCTEAGMSDGEKCSVCGEILTAQKEIPATGHKWGKWTVTKAATCTAEGEETRTCKNDASHKETRPVAKIAHKIEKIAGKEATCTEKGLTEGEKCSVCGEIITKQTEIPAKGHDYGDWTVTKAATCTAEGEETRTCKNDASHKETRPVAKIAHTPEKIAGKEATCTEAGLTEGEKCSVCGEILTAQKEIPAKGHTAEKLAAKEPTCTEKGLTEGEKCSVCGEIIKAQEEIPALGHQLEKIPGKPATCTEAGLTDGEKCTRCGEIVTEQKEIPALGHKVVTVYGVEATCEKTGLTDGQKCSVCGTVIKAQTVIAALGHNYVIVDKTDTQITYRCSRCGATYTETIAKPAEPTPVVAAQYGSIVKDAKMVNVNYTTATEGKILVITADQTQAGITAEKGLYVDEGLLTQWKGEGFDTVRFVNGEAVIDITLAEISKAWFTTADAIWNYVFSTDPTAENGILVKVEALVTGDTKVPAESFSGVTLKKADGDVAITANGIY